MKPGRTISAIVRSTAYGTTPLVVGVCGEGRLRISKQYSPAGPIATISWRVREAAGSASNTASTTSHEPTASATAAATFRRPREQAGHLSGRSAQHLNRCGRAADSRRFFLRRRIARIFYRQRDLQARVFSDSELTTAAFDLLANLRCSGKPHRKTPSSLAASSLISTGGVTFRMHDIHKDFTPTERVALAQLLAKLEAALAEAQEQGESSSK